MNKSKKIGRNDPCPCGSGKKYKKCCLNKDINNICTEGLLSDFAYIEDSATKITSIISEYKLQDIIRAVFCFNLWRRNRSALAQALTLNMAISKSKQFGDKSIETYSDLTTFYNSVSMYLKITPYEDYTIDDFGEVYINYKDTSYPIILGTGHSQVYAAMNFMITLADIMKKDSEMHQILSYSKMIIESLQEYNLKSDGDILFELPTNEFWESVNNLFNNDIFKSSIKNVYSIMPNGLPIERQHFMTCDDKIYPLANVSLLVDYYHYLITQASDSNILEHIDSTFFKRIEHSFNFSKDAQHIEILIKPQICDQKTVICKDSFMFAKHEEDSILIAVNLGKYNDLDSLKKDISKIEKISKSQELLIVEGFYRQEIGRCLACKLDKKIQWIFVKPFTDISTYDMGLYEESQDFYCSALDIFYILSFSDSFSELTEFIDFDINDKSNILSIGGKSDLFFAWKNNNHFIESGAIKYNMISLGYGTSDEIVYSCFEETFKNCPKHEFFNPLNWVIKQGELDYSNIIHKGCHGYGGEIKNINENTYVFLTHNVEFFSASDFADGGESLKLIDELNQRLFDRYAKIISEFCVIKNRTLEILYMPMDYIKKNNYICRSRNQGKKYVYSDEHLDNNVTVIRFSVKIDILMNDIINAKDRSVESQYFIELLQPLKSYCPDKFEELKKEIKLDSSLPKTVDVFTTNINYYYSSKSININIDNISRTKAMKNIAQVCFSAGIKPGQFFGRNATKCIREMQDLAVKLFEQEISLYDKRTLHFQCLEYYAFQQHSVFINKDRYQAFSDLDVQIKKDLQKNTIKTRENNKQNIRILLYLLESNLIVSHENDNKICKQQDFIYLLALAECLVGLQDTADVCYYNDNDVSIVIDDEYKVDITYGEHTENNYEIITERKYNNLDYNLKNDDIDKDYAEQCIAAFYKDTNVDFRLLMALVNFLQTDVTMTAQEIQPNVFEIEKSELIDTFHQTLIDKDKISIKDVSNAIEFITLDETKLKMIEGKQNDILPVWNREKRNNRFDVKPIICNQNQCIFSPVVLRQLEIYWRSGLLDWYLPYEIGLDSVMEVLKKWKNRYENEMVQDIAKIFHNKKFELVETEFEFFKRFPKENYPTELGDYDILAISHTRKEIWLIESKVLQKVGSIYEDQMQQKSFFFQHKDDEKFQRRIDYFENNIDKILKSLKIECNEYTIKPYMVTNKIFMSRYKTVDYPIITFSELQKILDEL